MKRSKGFTAIEVLVVVTILGILLAIGVPFYFSYRPRLILNRAAAQIRSDLMLNRQRAVTTSNTYFFKYDSANQSYEILRVVDGGDTLVFAEKFLPPSIHMDGDASLPDTLNFYPNGLTNGQGRLFLYHSGTNDTIRVIVTRSGFIRYER
jgi:prepilin-type N-terminal cleavage/methylation domain-containing protein